MIRTIHKHISVLTKAETLEVIATGPQTGTMRLLRVFFETVADMYFRGYVGQDRICEAAGELAAFDAQGLEIDRELKPGEQFSAGWYNDSAGTLHQSISVQVEEIDVP